MHPFLLQKKTPFNWLLSRMPPFRQPFCFLIRYLIGRKGGNGCVSCRTIMVLRVLASLGTSSERPKLMAHANFLVHLQGRASGGVWQVCHFFGFFCRKGKLYVSSPKFMLSLFGCGFRPTAGGALLWPTANQPTFGLRATPSGRCHLFHHRRKWNKLITADIK